MIVLASQSPRRAELLRNAGIEFRVQPAHVAEEKLAHESPRAYVERLSRDKAGHIYHQLTNSNAGQHTNLVVLGADTVVVLEDELLEKPRDAEDARRMLSALRGRAHEVMTGICVATEDGFDTEVAVTEVRFTNITDEEIAAYVATGEPMDKAGAYGIQGIASRWIDGLNGCYFNVVGLPVPRVYAMLFRRGILS